VRTQPLQAIIDKRGVCTLTLNAPERHNALDGPLVALLVRRLREVAEDNAVRVVILTGKGESFSSGADLKWMQAMGREKEAINRRDAHQLASLMQLLNFLPKPTLARVNGPAYGGSIGLVACCDLAIASSTAQFAFREVQLGLVPAVIAPYVAAAMGLRQARRFFLSGESISSATALQLGLVHQVVAVEELELAAEVQVQRLLKAPPAALAECKRLLARLETGEASLREYTAELLARLRRSPQGQEGMAAFLEKRPPRW
jgi:methylglutaconyl-CoA hydratase